MLLLKLKSSYNRNTITELSVIVVHLVLVYTHAVEQFSFLTHLYIRWKPLKEVLSSSLSRDSDRQCTWLAFLPKAFSTGKCQHYQQQLCLCRHQLLLPCGIWDLHATCCSQLQKKCVEFLPQESCLLLLEYVCKHVYYKIGQ